MCICWWKELWLLNEEFEKVGMFISWVISTVGYKKENYSTCHLSCPWNKITGRAVYCVPDRKLQGVSFIVSLTEKFRTCHLLCPWQKTTGRAIYRVPARKLHGMPFIVSLTENRNFKGRVVTTALKSDNIKGTHRNSVGAP
jgi:hypothetical protein